MKKYILNALTLFVIALFSLTLTSCLDTSTDETQYYTAFATVLLPDSIPADSGFTGYPYYFLTDNSKILVPVNYSTYQGYKPSFNDRILIYYSLFSKDDLLKSESQTPTGDVIDISVAEINTLYSKTILNTDKPDTLANHLIDIQSLWISGGKYNTKRFLNFAFQFQAASTSIIHNFYLVNDLTKESSIENGYLHLNFRHDNMRDSGNLYNLYGYVCFPIDEIYSEELQGLKISYNSYSEGETQVTVSFKEPAAKN